MGKWWAENGFIFFMLCLSFSFLILSNTLEREKKKCVEGVNKCEQVEIKCAEVCGQAEIRCENYYHKCEALTNAALEKARECQNSLFSLDVDVN